MGWPAVAPGRGKGIRGPSTNCTSEAPGPDLAGVEEDLWGTRPRGPRTGRLHLVSDVPGRLRARFNREAHEALEEAMRLCKRADHLRADVSRIVAVSMAADGHTTGHREITDQAVA